jgi:hypothetical protein
MWSNAMSCIGSRYCPSVGSSNASYASLNWSRRLSNDYELRHISAETMIHIAFVHFLRR